MPTGKVKWFDKKKGYGFIAPDEGGKDIFVHHHGIEGDGFLILLEDWKVEYEIEKGEKGPCATKVKRC